MHEYLYGLAYFWRNPILTGLAIIGLCVISAHFRQICINTLILASRWVNVLCLGQSDEMLCSRAWRLRRRIGWRLVQLFFDYVFLPLAIWRFPGMTHCQSCFWAESTRLREKLKELEGVQAMC